MPFLTDATWPAGLQTIFDIGRHQFPPHENRYYGPYSKLLEYCIGSESFEFFVAPQAAPSGDAQRETVDFVVYLAVFNTRGLPVLIAEIKNDAWVDTADLRLKAEDQIRQRYSTMLANCPLPRLWGLSLLGTSLRVYVGDVATGKIEPAFTDRPNSTLDLPGDLLEGAWNIDILSQDGFDTMKEIVGDIIGNAVSSSLI